MKSLICESMTAEEIRNYLTWIASLSNGQTAFQKDEHPDMEFSNSWLGLKKYCEDNQIYVKDLYLRFRDHLEPIAKNADGFFFIKSILGNITGYCQNFYHTGAYYEGKNHIKVDKWLIPEILVLEHQDRLIDETVLPSLIRKVNG